MVTNNSSKSQELVTQQPSRTVVQDKIEPGEKITSQFSARLAEHNSVSPGESCGNIQGNKCGSCSRASGGKGESLLLLRGLLYSPQTSVCFAPIIINTLIE